MEPKSYREFAASIIETLEALGIEYAIGGSFASSAYGEARTTADIAAMLIVQGASLDYDYIGHWAQQVGALDVWNRLLAEYRQRLHSK